mmetsp:Transcript_50767/g.99248  ORF Transcript_50767/g.99248 Transcript_50767/m.99248 type:complete len:86 (-) Transcript_50767:551-808(-)
MIPTRENGARDDKFFTKHNGRSTNDVNPNKEFVRVTLIPMAARRSLKVSAKIMEYAKFPAKQSKAEDAATIQAYFLPRVFSHASA